MLTRLLLAAYFLEAGLILIAAPWSGWWDRNLFLAVVPGLRSILSSPFTRGGVSGIGAVTVLAGLAELASVFVRRERPDPQARL